MVNVHDEDMQLILAFRNGQQDALSKLFQKYLPLIKRQMKLYRFNILDTEDLLQESRIVLYDAVLTYDFSKHVCFFTYFKHILRNHFIRLVRHYAAYKRKTDFICVSYDELEMDNYIGKGYTQTLNPMDVLMVRESFDDGYKTLTRSEQSVVYHKYCCNNEQLLKRHTVYRCEKKLKKAIRCE